MVGRVFFVWLIIAILTFTGDVQAAELLRVGDRGVEVREIQEMLAEQGYLTERIDGVFGSATVNALKKFQKAAGLKVDGICGKDTMAALKKLAADPLYALPGSVIKKGMHGEGVVIVQQILRDYGYYKGDIDGKCGSGTVRALQNFQRDYGLTADGVCGRQTYAVMEGAYEGSAVEPEGNSGEVAPDLLYNDDDEIYDYDYVPPHSRPLYVEATAYSPHDDGNGGRTATGTLVRRGVVAVDPQVIPLGTKVYIPGYGMATAEDIGGSIKGHHIDIAFDTTQECFNFGRQRITVYIIDKQREDN